MHIQDLMYDDSNIIVSGRVIFKNGVLCLFLTVKNLKSGNERDQHIPLEFYTILIRTCLVRFLKLTLAGKLCYAN